MSDQDDAPVCTAEELCNGTNALVNIMNEHKIPISSETAYGALLIGVTMMRDLGIMPLADLKDLVAAIYDAGQGIIIPTSGRGGDA